MTNTDFVKKVIPCLNGSWPAQDPMTTYEQKGWWVAVKDYQADRVCDAVVRVIKQNKWRPEPAVVIDELGRQAQAGAKDVDLEAIRQDSERVKRSWEEIDAVLAGISAEDREAHRHSHLASDLPGKKMMARLRVDGRMWKTIIVGRVRAGMKPDERGDYTRRG